MKNKQYSIRLNVDLMAIIDKVAKRHNRTRNNYIETILIKEMERENDTHKL